MKPGSRTWLHVLRITLGVLCVIAGIIGLLLPIVPQTIFFILAAILLFPDHPRIRKLLDKIEPKYPRLINFLERLGIGDTEPEDDPDPRPPSAAFMIGTNEILRDYDRRAADAGDVDTPPDSERHQ